MVKQSAAPWFLKMPALLRKIKKDLKHEFKHLRLIESDNFVLVRGALPIEGIGGVELERYQIEIAFPPDFPKTFPSVRETGGKIPKLLDRHIAEDGTACLFVDDESWKFWNEQNDLIAFLKGPVYQFFLSQIHFEEHGTWPFGQRKHGAEGVAEYYFEELGTDELSVVINFLDCITSKFIDKERICYCGHLNKLGSCHIRKVAALKSRISSTMAKNSLAVLKTLKKNQSRKKPRDLIQLASSISILPSHGLLSHKIGSGTTLSQTGP